MLTMAKVDRFSKPRRGQCQRKVFEAARGSA
jgi:hypothetical protein